MVGLILEPDVGDPWVGTTEGERGPGGFEVMGASEEGLVVVLGATPWAMEGASVGAVAMTGVRVIVGVGVGVGVGTGVGVGATAVSQEGETTTAK
jgi:hypothetical protein